MKALTAVVEKVSSGSQVGVLAFTAVRYAQSNAGDVIAPVRPAQLVYANFKHIQVRPDSRLENGVPLYKLRILDALIERISRGNERELQGNTEGAVRTRALAGNVASRQGENSSIDQLIAEMAQELRPANVPGGLYRAGFLPEPGAFVDLVA